MIQIERIKLTKTPLAIYDHLKESPYSFFLDSALTSGKLGKFSFIGIEPFLIFKSKKDNIELDWMTKKVVMKGNPFLVLKGLIKEFNMSTDEAFPIPFIGGGVGYFSYDLKDFNEKLPDRAKDDIDMPECIVCFYDCVIGFNHSSGEYFIASSGYPERGKKRTHRRKARMENIKDRVQSISKRRKNIVRDTTESVLTEGEQLLESNFTKESYVETIEKAKEYIRDGDIYQVNLSQRFKVNLNVDAFDLYKILRTINPAPFACFLNFDDVKVVSASPERFLKKEKKRIQTRPIKGTRPRGRDPVEDHRMKEELTSSIKDKAENLMIIDLERNDLGRICEYGTIRVTEFMKCEEYATVFHLVSTIEGDLRENVDAIDCLVYCFPGGSITGAPKIRSMEIIEELEPVKRGIYTGSIGYIGFDGNMDSSIVIRTFVIKDKCAYFHVGGGIVSDSDPEKEYQETLDKAKALIDAISYENSLSQQKVRSA